MTIDNEIIEELARCHFADRMPEDFRIYLFDRYGEEPIEGELAEQFFYPAVHSDIEKYIRGKLDTTPRTELQKLQDRYDELSDITCSMAQDTANLSEEVTYLSDFVQWLGLEQKYQEFKEHAYLKKDENLPFSRYVL